jgi:opacity protein-like surface antigen
MNREAASITEHDTLTHRGTAVRRVKFLRTSVSRCVVIAGCFVILGMDVGVAAAQEWGTRGIVDLGATTFSASESFEAILGTATGTVFGGGGEVILPQQVFASVRASRFQKSGERVFVFEGETMGLGIDTTVRVTPIELTGGYRFGNLNRRFVPYAGAGIGWHRYEETSEFAEDSENVKETFRGYHLLGGAEFRIARWFGVGGEFQWTTVPDALGQDGNGVSAAFEENDLGGTAFRVRFVVGR